MSAALDVGQPQQRVVDNDKLLHFTRLVLRNAGMPERDAGLMADHLLWAQRRGISWLGVRKLTQYVARIRAGGTKPDAEPVVLAERGAIVLIDACDGFGQVVGYDAMHRAVENAKAYGVGAAVVRNTTSAGALGYFALLAAEHGMIGVAINNSPPLQPPWGGREKLIGNQAFAIGCPADRHPPLLLDMATSAITLARIHDYQSRGAALPEGVALDADGRPTVDPAAALSGILLPMGGHRGYGLALMWEVLTGVLAGGPRYSTNVTAPDDHDVPQGVSMLLLAIDPSRLMPYETFLSRVDRVVDLIHGAEPATGSGPVLVPGERSHANEVRSLAEGISIPAGLAASLTELGRELGVPVNLFD